MSVHREQIAAWQRALRQQTPETILRWAAAQFPGRVGLASSLGVEDQALTDMLARSGAEISVFTLDTGRLFPETYQLIEQTRARYGVSIQVLFPQSEAVEEMVNRHGVNLFMETVELRKKCCHVRKIEPLRRALKGLDAWMTGLRREQSITRHEVAVIEWDQGHGLVKLNPLAAWSEDQVWAYVREHNVPYNPLHDRGFPSIGCSSCTRAVQPGDDPRSGRWWWEQPEQRECGLHLPVNSPKHAPEAP